MFETSANARRAEIMRQARIERSQMFGEILKRIFHPGR